MIENSVYIKALPTPEHSLQTFRTMLSFLYFTLITVSIPMYVLHDILM